MRETFQWQDNIFQIFSDTLASDKTLWASSADDKYVIFNFSQKRVFDTIVQIVCIRDNLHKMSKPVFWEKQEKYFIPGSVENFTQHAKR